MYIYKKKEVYNRYLNYEVYSFFEGVPSGQRIIKAKIRLLQQRNKKQTDKSSRDNWSSQANRDWEKISGNCKEQVEYSIGDIWTTYSKWKILLMPSLKKNLNAN